MKKFGGEIIKKIINGYLKNITENTCDNFNIPAIINKNKINYIFNDTKHIIHINNNEIILLRENKDMKNILTLSKNRSILSEYIIKSNNIQVDILVETLDLLIEEDLIYVQYKIPDSNCVYEYRINIGG